MILFSFELWFQRVAGYESPLTFGHCPNWGDPLPKLILTLFFLQFHPQNRGFCPIPYGQGKNALFCRKIRRFTEIGNKLSIDLSTIKSSINWIYTIYGIIHHNNMEFRVFASANTLIHTLVCLFVKYRWDYVVLVVEGSKIILLLELTGRGHRTHF